MTRRKIDKQAISSKIEGLSIENLEKAYKRYRKRTKRFQNKNVRDPLDHIDFEVNLSNELEEIKHKIECGDYAPKRPLIHYSPKKNGISRPTVSLQLEDVIVYLFCLEQFDKELIEKVRNTNIRGGVMLTPTPFPEDGDFYEHYFKDWMELMDSIRDSMTSHPYIATTDIASYFDNVDIEVLEELLRHAINDKPNTLSLLCYILQEIKLRYGYRTTLKTGLLQDDSDASRLLAYFYLYQHDNRMMKMSAELGADYFRFADDMSFTVRREIDAKKALRQLSDSLRQLGLTASIEKTTISTSKEASLQMLEEENKCLSDFEERLRATIDQGKDRRKFKRELVQYYKFLIDNKLYERKNWIKVLKRFYTLATFLQDDFLLKDLCDHLLHYPALSTGQKLERYFIANQNSLSFDKAIEDLVSYLESAENLYPQTETDLIEILCAIDYSKIGETSVAYVRTWDYVNRAIFGHKKRPTSVQSDYAKGLCLYLLYKLDPPTNEKVAQLYLKTSNTNNYYKKCLILVSLTVKESKLRTRVKNKLKTEAGTEMKRLNFMISSLGYLKNNQVIKKYKANTKFTLYYNERKDNKGKKHQKKLTLYSLPIRVKILRDILKLEAR